MPIRIQRKRSNGWKAPEGAIYVGRPTKWGNPFPVQVCGIELSMKLFRETASGDWNPSILAGYGDEQYHRYYQMRNAWIERLRREGGTGVVSDRIRAALRGKDLMCWCLLDQPCHADVLLEIANS